MWQYEYFAETDAKAEIIWKLWSNIETWTKWDRGIEKVTLDGNFMKGSHGKIKSVDGHWMNYRLIAVEPLKSFTNESEIPGTNTVIRFIHMLQTLKKNRTKITVRVEIDGNEGDKVGKEMGPSLTSAIPETIREISELALQEE